MKKSLTTTLLLLFAVSVFSQDVIKNREYYLQKSKEQKTLGWIFLGGGAGLIVAGISIQTGEANADFNFSGTGLAIAGVAASLVSIHFFKKAAKYKKLTATIGFKNQPLSITGIKGAFEPSLRGDKDIPKVKNNSLVYIPMPSVSIKIKL